MTDPVDKKTSQEDAATSVSTADLIRITQGVGGTPTSKKATIAQVLALATGGGGSDLGAAIQKAARTLRRGINGYRPEPSATNRLLAYTQFEGARKTNTDGVLTVWEPDGAAFYGAAWTRDQAMSMEGFLEYFTPAEISAVATYFLSKSNVSTGEVPDHISHSGTVFMAPAPTGRGSRAPIDGNFFLLQMFWLHYVQTGSPALYEANKVALKQLLEFAALYNPTSKCAVVDDASPYVGFGFYDMAILTGDVLYPSILAVRAFQMAAEMEFYGGDDTEAARLLARANEIIAGINSTFVVHLAGAGTQLTSPYNAREMCYGKLATTRGVNQIDLWGTAMLAWCDIVSESDKKAIGNYLLYVTTINANNYYRGGLRNVEKSTDYTANTAVYQSTFVSPAYGTYQNGGFWPTPMPMVIYVINLVDPVKARLKYMEEYAYSLEQGAASFGEWWNTTGTFGATKYLSSVVALLTAGITEGPVLVEEEWSGCVRLVANETLKLVLETPIAGIITNTKTRCASGTAVAAFQINGAALGGTANNVSSSIDRQPHVSANVFAVGDTINLAVSGNTSCVDLYFTINYLRAA